MRIEMLSQWDWVLLDASIKGAAVLAGAWILSATLRRGSAAVRHFIWTLSLIVVLAMPLLSTLLPAWRALPSWATMQARPTPLQTNPPTLAPAMHVQSDERPTIRDSLAGAPQIAPVHPAARPASDALAAVPVAPQPADPILPISPAQPDLRPALRPMAWVYGIWATGCALLLLRILTGRIALALLARRSQSVLKRPLIDLLRHACRDLNIKRPVALLQNQGRPMPMTWGVLVPKLLLPAEAGDWPLSRQRMAIWHELAHVRRCDALWQLIARCACAIYWFNPLVWLAARGLRKEQERAADDLVLSANCAPSDYAELLLDLTSSLRAPSLGHVGGICMARTSALESRLRAVLDPRQKRRQLTRALTAVGLILAVAVAAPIAVLRARSPQPSPSAAATTRPAAYSGRILSPDGKPVAGAEVSFVTLDVATLEDVERAGTRSGADGTFAFPGVPIQDRTTSWAVVRAPGFGITGAILGRGQDNEIVAPPSASVRILFQDWNGKPVAGLRVAPKVLWDRNPPRIRDARFSRQLSEQLAQQTDAEGFCTFADMPRNSILRLRIDDPRFMLLVTDTVEIGDEPRGAATMRLKPAGSISGTVTYGPTGKPAAGAVVFVQPVNGTLTDMETGKAVANDRGEYRIQQLSEGRFNVMLLKTDEWVAVARQMVRLDAGQNVSGQDLTLTKGSTITGRVVLADTGAGVANASIGASGPHRPLSSSAVSGTRTAGDGTYSLHVAPGANHVYFQGNAPDGYGGLPTPAQDVAVADGQTLTVDFKLPRMPGKPVSGRVLGPDGQPVADALVSARRLLGPTQYTDEQGRFKFAAITPGTQLRASRASLETIDALTVNGGEEDVVLRLAKREYATILGSVTDADGHPLQGARITDGANGLAQTDAQGRYRIGGVQVGHDFWVTATADGYGRAQVAVTPKAGEPTIQAAPLQLKKTSMRIAGQVLDKDGLPVWNAIVEINGDPSAGNQKHRTDQDGRFSISVVEGARPLIYLRGPDGTLGPARSATAGDENILLRWSFTLPPDPPTTRPIDRPATRPAGTAISR